MPFVAPEGTELVRLLGGGSVFEVGLVRAGERALVCKRLGPRARASREGRVSMVREARLLSLVDHPSLPRLEHVGQDAAGPFFLETFVEGTPLRALVEGWRARGKPVPPTLVRHVATLALEALAELHELADEAGPLAITHGDLGPDHVIVGPLGEIRFVDLGAARFRGLEPELDTDDRGTLPYAPPEVARGEARPSPSADVYALAATLLFCATGRPLCEATGEAPMLAEIGARGLRRELVDGAPAFGPREREAVRRALDPDPAARLTSARALLRAFDPP
ncbi:protein kinase domain-containing protein [Polyangium aurulentum]|uniref:protein kinase domain-containing protein n=1 Tax=Polyangium aurulentum TaxID=2567896 RepID=UPI0010AE49C9|nr:protein kinase [Polyangium aurulentum]UQA63423.1 protein kinase [Polyangium aurulentum]